ncbi:MAG: N-acetylmuramoyl-L-alanine amidase [Anaerotruncus sp.]|nr:N-acetylmuramoyl-L-alanine amidase [Anaerotruncus sp.]
MTAKKQFRSVWLLLAGFCALAVLVLISCWLSIARLPDNLGRVLTGEEKAAVLRRNSPLIEYAKLTTNADFPRTDTIRKITIHHMAGNLSLEKTGEIFSDADRKSSANYAIDSQGRVAIYVEEANRAWTSGSKENDSQAVTIEVANDEIGGDWHVSDQAYQTLIALCTDICRRNGIASLDYTGDAQGSLTTHKMFATTECPGPYLEGQMEKIAQTVNRSLSSSK